MLGFVGFPHHDRRAGEGAHRGHPALLDHWDHGLKIVVSAFAIAEIRSYRLAGAPGPGPGAEELVATVPFDPVAQAEIRQLFESDQLIVRPLIPVIAERAADIGNQFPALLPADCVHIATALDFGVDVLFTYDGATKTGRRRIDAMLRYDGRIGEPPLPIREPFDPWPNLGLTRTSVATSL